MIETHHVSDLIKTLNGNKQKGYYFYKYKNKKF